MMPSPAAVLLAALATASLVACGDGNDPEFSDPADLAVDTVSAELKLSRCGHGRHRRCPPDGGTHDAGRPDAGTPDAGRPDAGAPDAGRPDGGSEGGDRQANLKVAFIADTGAGSSFTEVLRLIESEGANIVMHQGDFDYNDSPSTFENAINDVLGPNFPYFVSVGNHDADAWDGYSANFRARYARIGARPSSTDWSSQMYSMIYKGLSLVFIGENGDSAFPTFIENTFANDSHPWKICSWHKNQKAMQVGGKGDEMGWDVYEACREAGAIVATGHEHSYHRTKTLSSMTHQTVDSSCSDPVNLCVSRGQTFAFVSGLGGRSIRDQERCLPTTYPYGCNGEWAKIFTSDQGADYGALFIVFNVNGDPRLARGYFKTVSGDVVDQFTIRRR